MPGPTTEAPAPDAPVADPLTAQLSRDGHDAGSSPVRLAVVRSEEERAEAAAALAARSPADMALELKGVSCFYGSFRAVRDVDLRVAKREVTALIGPSGCGKTTLLRTLNRMNDLVPSFRMEGSDPVRGPGSVRAGGRPGRGPSTRRDGVPEAESVPEVDLRQRRVRRADQRLSRATWTSSSSKSLRRAALWNEVKDKLKQSGLSLSGGQQQRLCIARAIATDPEIVLMDEPCSALDPRATLQIEELMNELKNDVTIVIVTHNMQQAARASDITVFLTMGEDRAGYVVETGVTNDIFTNPKNQLTEDYVSGRFG